MSTLMQQQQHHGNATARPGLHIKQPQTCITIQCLQRTPTPESIRRIKCECLTNYTWNRPRRWTSEGFRRRDKSGQKQCHSATLLPLELVMGPEQAISKLGRLQSVTVYKEHEYWVHMSGTDLQTNRLIRI